VLEGCDPTESPRSVASPNIIAYLMLFIWPLVCWQLWLKMDKQRALIWTILGGYLIMPPLTVINLPVLPDLDKNSIPNLMALYCAIYIGKESIKILPDAMLGKILIVLYAIAPFATVLTNGDPLIFQVAQVQGMKIYDSFAAVSSQLIALIPFFLARKYLGTPEGLRTMLMVLITAGLAYSLPMLIESRFSPQMNVWVYGFFQHDFSQTIRQGGYRPMVFLPHGLWAAFFALMCLLAGVMHLREANAVSRPKAMMIAGYLAFILLVCKSAGVMIYAIGLVPLILFMSWRLQVIVAGFLAAIVVIYPMLRGLHLLPMQQIVDFAASFSPERAGSLQFRINNEELLLARAQERPWFGWGGYGRAFLHDPVTGEMTTIADGAWVIDMGTFGWLGFIAEFGLGALPLLALAREALSRHAAPFNRYAGAVALILAANLVDLLPNATLIPFTWLMAGALLGEAERLRSLRRASSREELRAGLHGGKSKRTVI
jgi:hypothetical protein